MRPTLRDTVFAAVVTGLAAVGALTFAAGAFAACADPPTVEDAQTALNRIERLDRGIRALCVPLPEIEPDRAACIDAITAFNALHGAP